MIKKVIHTADWHIKHAKDHKIAKSAIRDFLREVEKISTNYAYGEVITIIVGDLFDNKNKVLLSNEGNAIVIDFLFQLEELTPVVITIGNHDYDIRNPKRQDCITPIINIFNKFKPDNKITYIKHTKCLEYGNLVLCNYSNIDGSSRPDIEVFRLMHEDKTFIGLYHDPLVGYVDFNNKDMTYTIGDDVKTSSIFDGCDFVAMGDIHKHQRIKADIPVVYAGSPYQLHFGESINGHGFVLWDVETHTYEFIEIANKYPMHKYTITIESQTDLNKIVPKLTNKY